MAVDCLDLEVNAHGADKGGREGVVSVSEQKGRLAHAAVANEQQLEHVVEVLVRSISLACWGVSSRCHLGREPPGMGRAGTLQGKKHQEWPQCLHWLLF